MQHDLCKNCQHPFEGNFCSNCGQKTNTKRLDFEFVKDELKYTFFHINKGLLYTAKQLFIRPAATIVEFIDGKRIQHYKPILLVFVLAGIEGLLSHYLNLEKVLKNLSNKEAKYSAINTQIFDWISNHTTFLELATVPLISLCSWLAFKKWGYNYVENIIINCFAAAQRLIIGIVFFPITFSLSSTKYFMLTNGFLTLITYGFTIYVYSKIYNKQVLGNVILRIVLFVFLLLMAFIIITTLIGFGYAFYLVKTGQLKD